MLLAGIVRAWMVESVVEGGYGTASAVKAQKNRSALEGYW